MDRYFSFFGSVEVPEQSFPALEQRIGAFSLEWHLYEDAQKNFSMDWAQDALRDIEENHQPHPAEGLEEIWRQDDDPASGSNHARAYLVEPGIALLEVYNGYGSFWEAAVVKWPFQFVAPAQIAAACCAPRYGLEAEN